MTANLILHSDPEVVQYELATLDRPGPIAARVEPASRRTFSLRGRAGFVGAVWRLGRVLRRHEYDVVNAHGLKASVAARLLVRLLRRRAVFVCGVCALHVTEVERLDSPKARLAWLVERALSRLVDVYNANTYAALDLLAELGIEDERLVFTPNGLDLSMWARRDPSREDTRLPLILCIARMVHRKRQEDLLHALAALRDAGIRFRAVVAGDGPTLAPMRALASRLGLDSAVELPGSLPQEQVREQLEEAAIACLPSAWEGMPGVLMEAMASGVAVVATDVRGTNELVVNGESGLLVPAYDPPALARALGTLLDDRELRDRLARGGRRRMEERFSLDAMIEAKERLYTELGSHVAT